MAASLNLVQLIGYLGRNVDLKYTQSNNAIASLSLATDESYTDRDGNKVQRTEWHGVVVYGRSAENCSKFLSKGSLVYVEGSLQTRKWQDQNGADRYSVEVKAARVQFLDRKESDSRNNTKSQNSGGNFSDRNYPDDPQPRASEVDDVPF